MTEEDKVRNKARDPIDTFKKCVLERKLLSEKEMAEVDAKAAATVEEALKFAQESPWPDTKDLLTDVYVNYP